MYQRSSEARSIRASLHASAKSQLPRLPAPARKDSPKAAAPSNDIAIKLHAKTRASLRTRTAVLTAIDRSPLSQRLIHRHSALAFSARASEHCRARSQISVL